MSKMDPETNLPKVGGNEFWMITPSQGEATYNDRARPLDIMLIQETGAGNHKVLGRERIFDPYPVNVRKAALTVLDRIDMERQAAALVGTYPPRKLEG